MVVKDMLGAIANHRKMARKIADMELPDSEKQLLWRGLDMTHTYEFGVLGPMYYKLGGGKLYHPEVLNVTGDYLFFTRVMDNVVDGHLTNDPLDTESREALLYGIVDYVSGLSDETELRRDALKKWGVDGVLEITKILKEGLPRKAGTNFKEDFSTLARVSIEDDTFDDLVGYERSLVEKGGYCQLVAFDIASMFPDFYDGDLETTRNFVLDMGTLAQVADDIKDNDHYFSKEGKKELFKKYKGKLETYRNKGQRFKDFEQDAYKGIVLIGLSSLKPYMHVRNYFSN